MLADRASLLGADHPATIAFELRLGRALIAAGRPSEAATVLDRAFRASEQVLGTDDLDTIEALDTLADACHAAGEVDRRDQAVPAGLSPSASGSRVRITC